MAVSSRTLVEEQTRIRHRLLDNGYVPLANISKRCVLPNWPRLQVDHALIDSWSRMLAYRATGVRIEGPLVALDFDIDDDVALDAIWESLPENIYRKTEQMPVRGGSGSKVCLFCRSPKKIANIWSSAFYKPGDEGGHAHRLEIFGAASGARQIGIYGAHTVENGEITKVYRWLDNRGLADIPLEDLPELDEAELLALADCVTHALKALGWVHEVRARRGRVGANTRMYILDDTHEFDVLGGGRVDLAELEERAAAELNAPVRVSMSWLEGPTARNRTRGIVGINPFDGRVQIWDTMTGILYRPGDVPGKDALLQNLNALRTRSEQEKETSTEPTADGARPGNLPPPPDAPGSEDDCRRAVNVLLARWAWIASGNGYAAPVGSSQDALLSLGGLKNTFAPWAARVRHKNGRETETNPVDVWIGHPDRITVNGHRLFPWTTDGIVEDPDTGLWINTYAPAGHETRKIDPIFEQDAVEAWQDFLTHLVPDTRERGWVEMWIAAKVQRPWIPNCGVVMVAETHGTGRGTLFDMLMSVIGHRHVRPVTSTELMGGSGQGQYTDWLADALLVVCDEVLAGNESGGALEWKRRDVYERLKVYVDPRMRKVRIVRKGLPAYETDIFASFLLATNNPNALPLLVQDRRFAVVRNTDLKLTEADNGRLHRRITAFRDAVGRFGADFGAAVWKRLRGLEVDLEALRDAPDWMEGRADMLAANETDLDEVLGHVLDAVEGNFITSGYLRLKLEEAIRRDGLDSHIRNWWNRAQDILARPNTLGWRRMLRRQNVEEKDGRKTLCYVYFRGGRESEKMWKDLSLKDRGRLLDAGAGKTAGMSKAHKLWLRVVENAPEEPQPPENRKTRL